MPVDVPTLEGLKLLQTLRVLHQHAWIIHELGQPDDLGMVHEWHQIRSHQPRPRRLHVGRGHAGRQLHPQVHDQLRCGLKEEPDALDPADIRDLVRVADCRRYAPGCHAAVELVRRHQRAFHMQMCVDEAGDQHLARDVDLAFAAVGPEHANNGIAADRHVGFDQIPGDQVEHATALQHQIGGRDPATLINSVRKGRFQHGVLLCNQGT